MPATTWSRSTTAARAYERIREEPFTLLLTDIVMPEMDGIELARRATELDPDLKVMFITGFAAVALNPDSNAPQGRQGPVQAVPPQGSRQRGREAAGRLSCCGGSRGLKQPGTGLLYGARRRGVPVRGGLGWAVSSAGEHYVDIVGVTGSIPVPPTISTIGKVHWRMRPVSPARCYETARMPGAGAARDGRSWQAARSDFRPRTVPSA